MNVFEHREMKRALLRASIVPTWKRFRAAVDDLVRSYNLIEEGKRWPAIVDEQGDTSIVISSNRGLDSDQIRAVSLVVNISLDSSRYAIKAVGEDWSIHHGTPVMKNKFIAVEFVLDGDPEKAATWLVHNGKKFSVVEATEAILFETLLHEPGRTVSVVEPQSYTISPY